MTEDQLLPTGLPATLPPAVRRRRRRQALMAAGLTGLVVTAPNPAGARVREVGSPQPAA